MKNKQFALGLMTGLSFWAGWVFYESMAAPSAAELAYRYEAFKVCINDQGCPMESKDWIEYYDLKWQIEGETE